MLLRALRKERLGGYSPHCTNILSGRTPVYLWVKIVS